MLSDDSETTPVAKQQVPNIHKWTNVEAVLSKRSVQHLRSSTTEELLEAVFFMWSAQRLCSSTDRVQLR
jgi:hypothetical protein